MTNLYFSTSPSDYERTLKEEIRGCVKYMNMPYETAMSMPIQDRRYYIRKHNEEVDGVDKHKKDSNGTWSVQGEALNAFAKIEQNKH